MMKKSQILSGLLMILLSIPSIALTAQLFPCTVIAYANANAYIQAPSYSQQIAFDSPLSFTDCTTTTAATIIVSNPPQNPSPTAPVYMNLYGTANSTQLLLMQGNTVITKSDFPTWFSASATYSGVTITCPATPYVPSSITIMYY
jgi:hypothetical protein